MAVRFFSEGIKFKLEHPRTTSHWIKESILKEKRTLSDLSVIFCSDKFLHSLNVQYLNHKTLTDIITFDYSTGDRLIAGEIYISIERVKENASLFDKTLDNELHRVIIHGVLHLIGYNDKTPADKAKMRGKEDAYLSLR